MSPILSLILLATPPLDVDDPTTCEPCHGTIVAAWRESLHSRAHHSRDPIYAALRTLRMKEQGDQVAEGCAQCHTPRAPVGDVEGGIHGVSCATCHTTAAIRPSGVGRARLEPAPPGVLLGPGNPAPNEAHGTGPAPAHFADGASLCQACHEQLDNPQGVGVCATGLEWRGAGVAGCTSCHMPEVNEPNGTADRDGRHRDHRFFGQGLQATAGDPAALALAARLVGDTLAITATNQTGHAYPTGFPGRLVRIEVEGFDAGGKSVWRADAPSLVLRRAFLDAAGAPTMPHRATQVGPDSRLTPGERRVITVPVPGEVVRVEVWAVLLAMPAPAAAQAGLPPPAPRLLAKAATAHRAARP